METSVVQDLGVAGDDADELFLAFDEKFGTDSSILDFERFFGHEGMWPWEAAMGILFLLWGMVRKVIGKPLVEKTEEERNMRVSDLVDAALTKKWNKKFEPSGGRKSGISAASIEKL
jgi:hypothetical protein